MASLLSNAALVGDKEAAEALAEALVTTPGKMLT